MHDAALARAIAGRGTAADPQVRNPHAEAELCRRFAPRVRLYGLRHLRDRHAAEDLVQQVLMTTLERLRAGSLRDPERLASFIFGMCRMTVLELRRGAARRERLLETWGDMEEALEAPEPRALEERKLAACLDGLAERERAVLVASFFADQSADTAANELRLTAGNVRVIRHRALAKLRECMTGAES
jgi:RNA polymerase sigma-70 factor (ECF subfamily)